MNKILVNCEENEDTVVLNELTQACGEVFELDESNIFTYETVNHFSEAVRNYYTICPNCGHLFLIKGEDLTIEMKNVALRKSEDDPLLFKKNILRAQLIYLESITYKTKTKVLFQTIK